MEENHAEETQPDESTQGASLPGPESLPTVELPLSKVSSEDTTDISHQHEANAYFETTIHQDVPDDLSLATNKENLAERTDELVPAVNCITSPSSLHNDTTQPALEKSHDKESPPSQKLEDGTSADAELENVNTATSKTENIVEATVNSSVAEKLTPLAKVKQDRPRVVRKWLDRAMSFGDLQAMPSTSLNDSVHKKNLKAVRGLVDTETHIESVKAAGTKFGGIVEWKFHKTQAMQSGQVELEIDKLHKEISQQKQQIEAAEASKALVLKELESTERLIEELKLDLDNAKAEDSRAREDLEFAQLMVKELEEGVSGNDSAAGKAQLTVLKKRNEVASNELKSVKEELRRLQEDYESLTIERDILNRKAEEALAASKETERTVEELTEELNKAKRILEKARATYNDAQEHTIGTALAREEDYLTWQKELKQAQEELQLLSDQRSSEKDLKLRLQTSSNLLNELKYELATYMEAKLKQETQGDEENEANNEVKTMQKSLQEAMTSSTAKLAEIKKRIEKARDEVGVLHLAAASLKSELDKEKGALANMKQMEGMASVAVSSLETELNRTRQELETVRTKEKEAREKMVELPNMLQQTAQQSSQDKLAAKLAQDEQRKAKEETEQAKAGLSTTKFRLRAVMKEIAAAKESEQSALDAIKALHESEETTDINQEGSRRISLALEEYLALGKKAHEAEEHAQEKLTAALAQVESAKESESRSLAALNETYKEMEEVKRALDDANEKAERATEGKLGMEQEMRIWRTKNKQQRKAGDGPNKPEVNQQILVNMDESCSVVHPVLSSPDDQALVDWKGKKKPTFFPRVMMFFARRRLKAQK